MMRFTDSGLEVGRVGDLFKKINADTVHISNEGGQFFVAPNSVMFSGGRNRVAFLEAPDDLAYRFQTNGTFTVMFWLKVDQVEKPYYAALINKEGSWEIGINSSGYISVALNTGSGWAWYASSHNVYSSEYLGNWFHVMWTWDGTYHRIYVNGANVSQFTNGSWTGTPNNNTNPLRIGARGYSTASIPIINFSMAEVRLFDGEVLDPTFDRLGFDIMSDIIDKPHRDSMVAYFPLHGVGDYANYSTSPNAGPGLTERSVNETDGVVYQLLDGGAVIGGDANIRRNALSYPGIAPGGRTALSLWRATETNAGGTEVTKANWFNDPFFMYGEIRKGIGWDETRNGLTSLGYWTTYNGGVASPELGYHAHTAPHQGLFGGNAVVLANENSPIGQSGRWLAIRSADLSGFFMNNITNGDKVTVSVWVKANNPDSGIQFGIYHYNPMAGLMNFQTSTLDNLYSTGPIGVVDEWVRVEKTFTIDTAYFDVTKVAYVYFYGNNNPQDGRVMISAPQIEVSTQSTRASGFKATHAEAPSGAINGVITTPLSFASAIRKSDFTFGAWTRQSAHASSSAVGTIVRYSNTYGTFAITQTNGDLAVEVRDRGANLVSITVPGVFSDGKWHHVAVQIRRNTANDEVWVYVDGAVAASDTTTLAGILNSANQLDFFEGNFYIGANSAGYNPLNSEIFDIFMINGVADIASYLKHYYNSVIESDSSSVAYDGAEDNLLVRPNQSGVIRVLGDRGWTVFDPQTGQMWGKYGRGAWERAGIIEEMPYGPGGTSLWFGPYAENHVGRHAMEGFRGWYSGIAAAEYEYPAKNGEFYRLHLFNPVTGTQHTEMLTGDNTAAVSGDVTATMRFIYRADVDYQIRSLRFVFDGSSYVVPATNIKLGENTYLAFGSYYLASAPNLPGCRAINIAYLPSGTNTYIEVAHPVFTIEAGDNGAKPVAFHWGKPRYVSTSATTAAIGGAHGVASGYIRFATASEIMGLDKTGTIILAFNPANHQPDPYGRIMVAGKDSQNGMLALIYGANYNSGNQVGAFANSASGTAFSIVATYNFSPWTWYYIGFTWGGGSAVLTVYDADGNVLATDSATYQDDYFPDFANVDDDSIIFGKKQDFGDSMNAILGPVAMSQQKTTDLDGLVKDLARGRVAIWGKTMYISGDLKTV